MRAVAGGATILVDEDMGGYRYRLAKLDGGFLISARSKNALGLMFVNEWFHETEDAARACLAAAKAITDAGDLVGTYSPDFEAKLAEMERKTAAHTAACARNDDYPLIGEEVKKLREAYGLDFA